VGVAVLLLGATATAAFNLDGWLDRAAGTVDPEESIEGQDLLDAMTSSRLMFAGQALRLMAHNPVTGVGPSRYIEGLQRDADARGGGLIYPVHNVPLLVGAEAGIAAGLLSVLLLVIAARRALLGPWNLAVLLAFLPFFLLDHFPLSHGQGVGMTALWLGVAVRAAPPVERAPQQ
jgi:hypothetical protein